MRTAGHLRRRRLLPAAPAGTSTRHTRPPARLRAASHENVGRADKGFRRLPECNSTKTYAHGRSATVSTLRRDPCHARDQATTMPRMTEKTARREPRASVRSTMCPSRSSSSSSRTAGAPTPRSARPSGLSEAAVRQRVQRLIRERGHADRRRHRPAPARVRPPGDDRDQRRRAARARSPRRSRAMDEVDYVVMTAGSFDVLCEVVCESDEPAARAAVRPHPGRARGPHHRDVHVPQARQADLLVGRPLSA